MVRGAQFAEMRSAVRFPLHLPMAVTTEARPLPAETRDISSGGVLFQVEGELPVGSPIQFSISIPAEILGTGTLVQVKCAGRVVRCTAEGDHHAVAAVIDEYYFERHLGVPRVHG
ncbi:MAG TPA: PilZ domain-containing protein [Terriglobales bacterium]|nr:PilZ domain-containing protein [Terriglobales bacterium]